ncbi:helix-turn-helix transcriptional regulator [Holzapfeliella sp. He02]|uniref:Helix-turn-helix transcriptional regulator n=1 Tax=Holzapfeliella saturejae TaxID=3082953 RepID=A0ABU8SJF0_9LACO
MTVFENIKKYATLKSMSIPEVALKSGLSRNAIYNWKHKSSDKINLGYLVKIGETLGVSYKKLLDDGIDDDKKIERKTLDLKTEIEDEYGPLFMYGGKEIPEEDLAVIKKILDSNLK